MQQPAPLGTLYLPWTILFLLYSLVTIVSYLLDMASHSLLAQPRGSLHPAPLSAAWVGYQLIADIVFLGLLPLGLTWTHSCWPLGLTFCHLDPGLAFLAFSTSGRLLTHVAADHCTSLLQPSWALGHCIVRQIVTCAGGFWILLLGLAGRALGTRRDGNGWSDPCNRTTTLEPPRHGQDPLAWSPVLDQLVFGFGVPLGLLSVFHSVVRGQLQLARLSGRPPLLSLPGATAAMLFVCWFPFHLLMLLKFLGMWGPRLQLGDVWGLLRPLGLTLLASTCFLNPLLYVCGDKEIQRQLGQALRFHRQEGEEEEEEEEEVAEEPGHWGWRLRGSGAT